MPKICMLSTGHDLLDDRIYHKEAISLAKKYFDITIIARGNLPKCENATEIQFISLGSTTSLLSRIFIIPKAVRMVLNIKPEICHIHDYELVLALPFIKLLSNCKTVYDVHEVYPEMMLDSKKIPFVFRPLAAKIVDMSERFLALLADCLISADDSISKRFNGKHAARATIFNYPRLSIFKPDETLTLQLKQRYKGRIPIIYHGSMSAERGLFHMIEAMEIIRDTRSNVTLLLVGHMDAQLLRKAEQLIALKSLSSNVDIVGWVPHQEVVNYISISKLGLVPFLPTKKFMKNVPIKQFEYMACGIPVLGANLPPIASYIRISGCGRTYNSTSNEELAMGVINMLKDDSELERMSEAGRKAVQNLWNWDQMEIKLFAVYQRLLRGCAVS